MLDRIRAYLVKFLLLLPFMIQVLVPVGMMPAVSSEGTYTLVICTGHGLDERTFPETDGEPESASTWCPFSLLSAAILMPAPVALGRTIQSVPVHVRPVERDLPATTDVATSRPRGPPSIL